MPTTSTERTCEARRRRARREVQLTIVLHQDDFWPRSPTEVTPEAACTDAKLQAEAVSLFFSDTLLG